MKTMTGNLIETNKVVWLRGQDLNLRPLGYEPNDAEGNEELTNPSRSTEAPLTAIIYGTGRVDLPQPFFDQHSTPNAFRGLLCALIFELLALACAGVAALGVVCALRWFVGVI